MKKEGEERRRKTVASRSLEVGDFGAPGRCTARPLGFVRAQLLPVHRPDAVVAIIPAALGRVGLAGWDQRTRVIPGLRRRPRTLPGTPSLNRRSLLRQPLLQLEEGVPRRRRERGGDRNRRDPQSRRRGRGLRSTGPGPGRRAGPNDSAPQSLTGEALRRVHARPLAEEERRDFGAHRARVEPPTHSLRRSNEPGPHRPRDAESESTSAYRFRASGGL